MICFAVHVKVQLNIRCFQGNSQIFFLKLIYKVFVIVYASCLAHELKKAVPMPCGSQKRDMSGPLVLRRLRNKPSKGVTEESLAVPFLFSRWAQQG